MAIPPREIFRINPIDEEKHVAVGIDLPLVDKNDVPFPQTYLTIDAAKANLKNLILTRKGERPFQPFLGTSIYDFLFDNNIPEMLAKMETELNKHSTDGWTLDRFELGHYGYRAIITLKK